MRSEAVLAKERAYLGRRLVEVSVELDLLESDPRDLGERAGHIGLHQVADGIQLEPDLLDFSFGGEELAGEGIALCDSDGGDAQGREKVAAGLHSGKAGEVPASMENRRAARNEGAAAQPAFGGFPESSPVACASSLRRAGMANAKTLPGASSGNSAHARPPMDSTVSRTMLSPSPVPSVSVTVSPWAR